MGGRGRGVRGGLVTRRGLPCRFPPEPDRDEGLRNDLGVLQLYVWKVSRVRCSR